MIQLSLATYITIYIYIYHVLTTLLPSRAYLTAVATEGKSLSPLYLVKKPCLLSASHTGVVGADSNTCTSHEENSRTTCKEREMKKLKQRNLACIVFCNYYSKINCFDSIL